MCEECLSEFEFTGEDLHGQVYDEEYELFVTCPLCENEIEIYDVEDYGFWPEDVIGGKYDGMESDSEVY